MSAALKAAQLEKPAAVSDHALRRIAEHGFFGTPGCLAEARSACSELLFARAMIQAQTVRIAELTARERDA